MGIGLQSLSKKPAKCIFAERIDDEYIVETYNSFWELLYDGKYNLIFKINNFLVIFLIQSCLFTEKESETVFHSLKSI